MSNKKCKPTADQVSDWFKNAKGSHERRPSLNLRLADNYNYPVYSSTTLSSSPPWSPYWSPTTKSLAGIPFAWEDKPGVSKQKKSPTPDGCFGDQPPRNSPSEFSVAEAFQVERRPHRRPEKRDGEVNPFLSAFVERHTRKPAAAVPMSKNGRQERGKEGYGSTYSCIKSCTVNADALVTIPARARQVSRLNNNKNTKNDWKNQKSSPGYKFGKN